MAKITFTWDAHFTVGIIEIAADSPQEVEGLKFLAAHPEAAKFTLFTDDGYQAEFFNGNPKTQ